MTYQATLDPHCPCLGCTTGQPCRARPIGDPMSVYRLYNSAGRLLYVGVTTNPLGRPYDHLGKARFMYGERVERIVLEHYATECEALTVEARAIRDESPLMNMKDGLLRLHAGWVIEPISTEDLTPPWHWQEQAS